MSPARIFLAAEKSPALADLHSRLEKLGYSVVAQAGADDDIVALAARLQPDLVLVDINLQGQANSVQIAGQLRALVDAAVIFFGSQSVALDFPTQMDEIDKHIVDPENEYELDLNIAASLYRHVKNDSLRIFSQLLAQSDDCIVFTDSEGRIKYANPQFEQTTGYALDELIGQTPRVLKSGEQSEEFYKQLWQTIRSGQIWRGELHNKRKDGSLYWESASISPVLAEDGSIVNFIGIKRDITERKQLEQAMHIKDSAISSSLNAIALADLSGRLSYVNPAFVRLWGYLSADDSLGRSVAAFWQEDAPIGQVILTILQGQTWLGEMAAKRRDGTLISVDVSAHLVQDENGNPLCLMASFVDITARKLAEKAEKEERHLADALRRSAEALGSTLNLGEVLDLIIDNAAQVIPNDSMSIMLLEGENLKVVGHRGYTERGLKDYIEKTSFKIEAFPSLIRMVANRQPCIMPYIHQKGSGWKAREGVDYIQSYAGAPICRGERVLGFLNLDSATPNYFTEAHAIRLQAFASQAAVAIENARLYEKDHILSITDGLTGLYNSRYFFELARLEFERFQRYPGNLSIVMLDVDYFKRVNDTFGHLVGDDVLRELARRVRACLRVVDIAARYGGEEFIILMAQTKLEEACLAAERIRLAVAGTAFDVPEAGSVSITVSLGVATLSAAHRNLNMLIKNADDALYAAKNSGRNQYVSAQVAPQG